VLAINLTVVFALNLSVMKIDHLFIFVSFIFILSCSQKKAGDTAQLDQLTIDSVIYLNSASYELIKSIINWENNNYPIRIYDSVPQSANTYEFLLEKHSFKSLDNPPQFLKLQENLKTYRIDSTELPRAKILPSFSIDFNKPYQEYKHIEPFWIIHSPIISKDGQTAVISIDNIIFGLGGEGWTLLLKKEAGKWVVLEKFYRWIG
jgi:hypothetical protein